MNLKEHLSHSIFHIISDVASENGNSVFVIGGFVRDLILKRESKDIDFVVLGSGIEIAKKVDAARPLPKNADAVDKLKFKLCREILIFKESKEMTLEDLALKFEIGKTDVSKIINYHIDRYTIDKLYRLTLKLIPTFHLDIAA